MNVQNNDLTERIWDLVRFEVQSSGYAQLDSQWRYTYRQPSFSRLYYIADGCAVVECAGERISLMPGSVYLFPVGAALGCSCPKRMTQLFFHITTRWQDGYDLFSRCKGALVIPSLQDVGEMCALYQSDRPAQHALLKSRVEADLWRFITAGALEDKLFSQHSPFLKSVFEAVQKNLRSSLKIGDIARQLSISESTLTKRFLKEFGIPLGRYMDEMLLQEICRLLSDEKMPVGAIAERLDFCDQFYLTRFFKRHQGETPSGYRKKLRERI